jgi:cell division protein FtsQ
LVGVAGAAAQRLLDARTLPLRTIELAGKPGRVGAAELRELLRRDLGSSFLSLRLDAVRTRLESHPWIERAVVRKRWPDRLLVNLVERIPVARWGGAQLVDGAGVRYPADTTGFAHLPLIEGPEGQEPAMLKRFREVDERLSGLGLKPAALVQSERRSWRITLANGIRLELGREDFELRLARFERAWSRVLAAGREQIQVLDLRYANGFAVRRVAVPGGDSG